MSIALLKAFEFSFKSDWIFRGGEMRFVCFVVLLLVAFVEIGPLPITPFVLIWVVLFRPEWFYRLVNSA